jgi:hypothetical protein
MEMYILVGISNDAGNELSGERGGGGVDNM